MNKIRFLGQKGQGTLLIVSVLCVVGVIVLMTSLDVFTKDYNYKSLDFDQVLLDEATSSSFAVMESALARRLWEPPPDSQCLKAESFSVEGELPNGVSWRVDTVFNFTTKNFEMTATGTYRKLKSKFRKHVKVLDVSDYLLFSGSSSSVVLQRAYSPKTPSALIAKDRRIYTKGPLVGYSMIHRPNPNTGWAGSAPIWPGEWGTVVQGDRMQFTGGIYYAPWSLPRPNASWAGVGNLPTLLAPYSNAWGTPAVSVGSSGAGSMVFTKSSTVAESLRDQVVNETSGPNTKSSLRELVYPVALFGGNPPLQAWSATDSGSYFNDVDRYSIFYYEYADANKFGIRMNATCMSRPDALTSGKYCSHSEHFPKGFREWRKDAGLEGYLYTSDAEVVPSPTMNWDNLEALEEDARACGQVISSPVNAYEDCAIWDSEFQKQYVANGAGTECTRVSRVDMESLSLNNFNAGQLSNASVANRLLRRVVYAKVPTEIRQSNNQGLMVGALSDSVARKKLALWVVGEDTITLRGVQPDTTSPLDTDTGRLREVFFNMDATGGAKPGISMVLLSPEQVHLVSPFYVPMSESYLKSRWPSSGGKIRPILHNLTDPRHEEDGFKYGYRRYHLNNVSLITTATVDAGRPFILKGLWNGPDSSAAQFIANQCMVTMAGHPLPPYMTYNISEMASMPTYTDPISALPPAGSRYYDGGHLPRRYYPNVFWEQNAHPSIGGARHESDLMLKGIRIYVDFDTTVVPGKRDLNTPLHRLTDGRGVSLNYFDLSHKHFTYNMSSYYQNRPSFTPCILENAAYLSPSTPTELYDRYAVAPTVNNGSYIFVHTSPDDDFRNVGSIVGVDQPVIETRNAK
ncbi:hypothetical protein ACLWBD_07830 [Bdellovibrio sp. HCB117]|uniref:hypothetical protein n=1 Tax=Bdellovibrio sp. HCB117 TaxID=3394359 RepID=UPI0039B57FDE